MTVSIPHRPTTFRGAEGNLVRATVWGEGGGPVAALMHGGGQTRHAWEGTARRLVASGWRAVAVDQRGHGDSDRSLPGNYAFTDYAADAALIFDQIIAALGQRPVAVGASLGGVASLLVAGEIAPQTVSGLVLVDVTPRTDPNGVDSILGFMGERMHEGFASLEEAAEVIAGYLPHRPRPRSLEGLRKNLRRGDDGRYRWHWDPRFIDGPRPISTDRDLIPLRCVEAARRLTAPTMLVRGQMSELVSEEHVRDFLALVPHAAYVDVSGAGHMVAGDRNDAFATALVDFLCGLEAA